MLNEVDLAGEPLELTKSMIHYEKNQGNRTQCIDLMETFWRIFHLDDWINQGIEQLSPQKNLCMTRISIEPMSKDEDWEEFIKDDRYQKSWLTEHNSEGLVQGA